MNKLSLVATTALILGTGFSSSVSAEQDIDIGGGWKFSGDLRTGYVVYDYGNPDGLATLSRGHKDSQGYYLVPKLSITTPNWAGFSAKLTGAAATDFGLNNPEKESRNFVFDSTDLESFAILQEAYIAFDSTDNSHSALVGRNELYTPMIETDDWYMLANSFEVVTYTNRSVSDLMLTTGYFHKMAGVWDSGANGTEFHSMSDASFVAADDKERADESGVFYLGAQFNNETHNGQLWGYHAPDLYNILFAQYDFSQNNKAGFSYTLGVQFIGFQETGELADHDTTNIDYGIYSARFDGSFANGIGFATGIAKYSDGEGQDATLGAWGGFPYFANGMIFHFFEAGSLQNSASYKVQGSYDFSAIGLNNLNCAIRYTYFDLDPGYSKSSTGEDQNAMQMIGFSASYDFLDGGYVTVKYENHDTDGEPSTYALRLIGGFRF